MGNRIVKQPNGLFARFSDIVDGFTHHSMTYEEALDFCVRDLGEREGKAKVQRAIDDDMLGMDVPDEDLRPDGLNRWRDAINTIELLHGKRERDAAVAEILGERR